MSIKNVENFYLLLIKDKNLSHELEEKINQYNQEGVFSKRFINEVIIPIAKRYGIDFSFEEFSQYIKNRYIGLTKKQYDILSEDDLNIITGGISSTLVDYFYKFTYTQVKR